MCTSSLQGQVKSSGAKTRRVTQGPFLFKWLRTASTLAETSTKVARCTPPYSFILRYTTGKFVAAIAHIRVAHSSSVMFLAGLAWLARWLLSALGSQNQQKPVTFLSALFCLRRVCSIFALLQGRTLNIPSHYCFLKTAGKYSACS